MSLPDRRFSTVLANVLGFWLVPMAVLYGFGSLVPRVWPFLLRNHQNVGMALLVLGAGVLVTGVMGSSSVAGGLGAMMLVGGFLAWRSEA